MLSSDHSPRNWSVACHRAIGMAEKSHLRGCPECITDDLREFGIPTWHCVHQVGPLKTCQKHGRSLVPSLVLREEREFVPLSDALLDAAPFYSHAPSRLQLALATNIEFLLTNSIYEIDQTKLLSACRAAIHESGRSVIHGSGTKTLASEIIATFGAEELALSDVTLPEARKGWLAAIIKGSPAPVRIQHYNVICELIGFSFRQLIDAATASQSEIGPWPCLSTGHSCSGALVIRRTNLKSKKASYRFHCPHCGTTYFRPEPLTRRPDGDFDYTLARGHGVATWALGLASVWNDPTENWSSLCARFGKSQCAMAIQAIKLGLSDKVGRSLLSCRKRKTTGSFIRSRIVKKRAQFLKFVRSNPFVPHARAPKPIRQLYRWLRQNDPKSVPKFGSPPTNCASPRRPSIRERDEEFAELIRARICVVELKLKECGKPRVSLAAAVASLRETVKLHRTLLLRMPKTRTIVSSIVETSGQARIRKFNQTLHSIEQSSNLPSWCHATFEKYGWSRLTPWERAQIRSVYESRCASNHREVRSSSVTPPAPSAPRMPASEASNTHQIVPILSQQACLEQTG
jgi:predicted RNA-binding Zn-ribbon protein involved in translation (DUF1610 family)